MAKPSIFSKDYDRKMKRRKRRIFIVTIVVVVLAIVVAVFSMISLKGLFSNVNKNLTKAQNKQNLKDNLQKSKSPETKQIKQSNSYNVQLSDGKTANVVYEVNNGTRLFKNVTLGDSNATYDISPSQKNVVLYDQKAQSIILLDINGNKQDITNPQYTATDGNVITKSAQLSSNSSYVWCSSPKFIDDNNIAYVSQLPWVGKTTKYVWIESLGNKNHVLVQGIEGENIKMDKVTDKGLTIVVDDKTVYLKPDGSFGE